MVLVLVAFVGIVRVRVVLVAVALVGIVRVPRLAAVVLVPVAFVGIVLVRVVFVAVALVDIMLMLVACHPEPPYRFQGAYAYTILYHMGSRYPSTSRIICFESIGPKNCSKLFHLYHPVAGGSSSWVKYGAFVERNRTESEQSRDVMEQAPGAHNGRSQRLAAYDDSVNVVRVCSFHAGMAVQKFAVVKEMELKPSRI